MNFFKRTPVILISLTILGALLHFFHLNWGAPFYFHPDERNIANAVSQLTFPNQMNPHFFAYGSLPIYAIYFTGLIGNFLAHIPTTIVSFEQAILISRIYSAFFATLLIPILFLIGRELKDTRTGLLAAFFTTMSVGLLQFSHFGTFEMWLTFFSVLLFWMCLKSIKTKQFIYTVLLSLIFGALLAIKVSSLALLPIPFLAFALTIKALPIRRRFHLLEKLLLFVGSVFFLISVTALVYVLTNPFVVLDTEAFISSMRYESGVGFNTIPVFYTGGFYDTIPVLYQFIKVYPFLLNPLMTIFLIFAFLFSVYKMFKTKSTGLLLLTSCFLILFLSQAFFFIKWTRYMVPTLPFIFLFITLTITAIKNNLAQKMAIAVTAIVCVVFTFSYFITAFVEPDTRIAAVTFAKKLIPKDAKLLSETHDLGNVVFNGYYSARTEFNFYDYDLDSPVYTEESLRQNLKDSDYFILASQRILQPRLENPKRFKKGNAFYKELLNGELGYQKIYETPCDLFCQITYLGDPIMRYEQTANVFDRPTVQIFKKLN